MNALAGANDLNTGFPKKNRVGTRLEKRDQIAFLETFGNPCSDDALLIQPANTGVRRHEFRPVLSHRIVSRHDVHGCVGLCRTAQ
jgi:hypothetical protein